MARRLVITVCPHERGVVTLAVDHGAPTRPLDAEAMMQALRDLVTARRLGELVRLREGCAGGCGRAGPNVDVRIHAAPRPGEAPDEVAIGWKTYVYSLASIDCVSRIIDDNLPSAD
jgi:hypothetical protein